MSMSVCVAAAYLTRKMTMCVVCVYNMYILYCTHINFVFLFNLLVSLEGRKVDVDNSSS